MTSSTFPARLRAAVDASGLSIRGLAKASGKSTGAVWAWLAGKYLPAADTIEALAAALNVSPSWLAFGHECETNNNSIGVTKCPPVLNIQIGGHDGPK